MSYDIIRGINFKDNKVNICSACNNITPQTFTWGEAKGLTAMLHEKGKEAVIKEILYMYWSGNFKKGNNLFDKTVRYYISRLPYTWGNTSTADKVGIVNYAGTPHEEKIIYSYDQLYDDLYKCYLKFKNRDTKKRWVIKWKDGSFVKKRTTMHIWFTSSMKVAKTFNSKEEAWLYHPVNSAGIQIVEKTEI